MKTVQSIFLVLILFIFGCKTPTPPQTLTLDGMTLTLPEGFKLNFEGNKMGFSGIEAMQNAYDKMDGGNTTTLKITRFDIAHIDNEDPDYVRDLCLGEYRVFHQEGRADTYKCSENAPLSIGGKNGTILTFDDTSDPKFALKGEIVALKSGKKIIILHYTDFSNHYEKSKADWESIKSSIKLN
jgi:hypothetical protein